MWLLLLLASFPIPTIDGKPPAATSDTTYTLPMRFDTARKFYVDTFATRGDVKLTDTRHEGRRRLVLTTRDPKEKWTKAVVTEREVDVQIEVTRVLRLDDEAVSGNAKPAVEFIFTRSPEVKKALERIDHTDSMRAD